jgi:YidC/Oxa1 family membrane protein insertase
MQLLEPKLAELRRKYRDDPQRLNQETMQLYKLYGINPISGCLPLLLQMPIFFALYSVFRSTIELRQAGFIGWIADLSIKDPYYVLPILMGVSFTLQSLLTPAQRRQRILQIGMAIFMTVIFLNFPSGLQLYWFTFNILSMIELIIVRRRGMKWRKRTS